MRLSQRTPNYIKKPAERQYCPSFPQARHGQVLTECIVALGLLAIAIAASSSMARAALLLSDDARLLTHATAAVGSHADAATLEACGAGAGVAANTSPRIQLQWSDAIAGAGSATGLTRHINVTLQYSPLARRSESHLTLDAGGVCP